MNVLKKIGISFGVLGAVTFAPVIPEGNGVISVAVFTDDVTGENITVQMEDAVYDSMAGNGGWKNNPTKNGYTFRGGYSYPVEAYKEYLTPPSATTTESVKNPQPKYLDNDDFVNLLEVLTPKADAAIAFDKDLSQNTAAGTTITIALGATSANSTAVITIFKDSGDTVNQTSGMKVDGNNATFIAKQNLTGSQWGYMFYYLNPPTGTVNYIVTSSVSSYWDMTVSIFSGTSQSGIDSSNTGSASPSVTLSTTVVAENSWLVSYARNTNSGVPAAGTGTFSREVTSLYRVGDSNGPVGTGAQTMQYTAAAGTTAGIIVSIAPVSTPSTITPNQDIIIFD